MAQSNQLDFSNDNSNKDSSHNNSKGVVHLSKHQEEKQTSESSAFEQVMMQMNIADRKSFDKKYSELWNEASESNELLSLMICEIDYFKAYHDNYGHQGASFMLLVIALALKTTCEEYGCYLGRYKGNEFGILLKGGNPESAAEIAEKLRLAVEKSRTEHKYSSVSKIVTLSIGLSSFYPTSMQVVMNQAGAALDSAKMSGRNKVAGHLAKANAGAATARNISKPTIAESESTVVEKVKQPSAEQLKKEEELKKAELLKKEAELKKAEQQRKEEERKKEEELMRLQEEEDRRKKEELSAYDLDPFF